MDKVIEQAAQAVVHAVDSIDDAQDSIANATRSVFAGTRKSDRKKIQTKFYAAIRAQYGADCSVGELKQFAKVGDLGAQRILRAYDSARKAVSRLFSSGKSRKAKTPEKNPSTGIVVPLTRDGMKGWINAAIAAIQDTEDLAFDANKMLAWARSGLDILG
jgi:hypothetical protein